MSEEKLKTIKSLLLGEIGTITFEEKKNVLEKINKSFLDKQILTINKMERRTFYIAFAWGLLAAINLISTFFLDQIKTFNTITLFLSMAAALALSLEHANLKKRKLIFNILKEL